MIHYLNGLPDGEGAISFDGGRRDLCRRLNALANVVNGGHQ